MRIYVPYQGRLRIGRLYLIHFGGHGVFYESHEVVNTTSDSSGEGYEYEFIAEIPLDHNKIMYLRRFFDKYHKLMAKQEGV